MKVRGEAGFLRTVQGQVLRQSDRREVAIFLWDGQLWVADFIDGDGKLMDATTWFRFNCGALTSPHGQRRMVLESAIPLSAELVKKIELLHWRARGQRPASRVSVRELIAGQPLPERQASAVLSRIRNRWRR